MEFNSEFIVGDLIHNHKIAEVYKCSLNGKIRGSLKTNTIVLIKEIDDDQIYDEFNKLLPSKTWNIWDDIEYKNQYSEIYDSNLNDVALHLFVEKTPKIYEYRGQVVLAEEPSNLIQHVKGFEQIVLELCVVEIGKSENITNLLLKYSEKELVSLEIIDSSRGYMSKNGVGALLELMIDSGINTLVSNGGWFLSDKGYYFNPLAKNNKWGKLRENNNASLFINQNKFMNPYFKNSFVDINKYKINFINSYFEKNKKVRINFLEIKGDSKVPSTIFKNPESKEKKSLFYTSVLIGPNGTGKSSLLASIQKIMLDMFFLKLSRPPQYISSVDFQMEYIINDKTYNICKRDKDFEFKKDNKKITLQEVELPDAVLSCAFTLQDRFSTSSFNKSLLDEYHYLGMKNKRIQDLSKNLTNNILTAVLTDQKFLMNLKNITHFLEFDPALRIILPYNQQIKIVSNEKDVNHLKFSSNTFFTEYRYKDKLSGSSAIRKFEERIEISLNFEEADIYETMYQSFNEIRNYIKNGLFEEPQIKMKKGNEWFDLQQASSGEFQFMSSMINILSKIKSGSIILIDEPETSLHPNWQFKYIASLKEIFKNYPGCHFIIATHSHFIVSDLESNSSTLIELDNNRDGKVFSKISRNDFYGKPTEDILYELFDIPTNRNYYLASDLDQILEAISLNRINREIKEKVKKLHKVQLNLKEEDPLNELINKISDLVLKDE